MRLISRLSFSILFSLALYALSPSGVAAQKPSLGIVNGRATHLPKPVYTDEAKNQCADGKVEVKVTINKHGRVTEAKSISGDSVLVGSSLDAAKKAEFRTGPPKSKGILVFNFDSFSKCLKAGVVNEKAISIPKPQLGGVLGPGHLRITQNQSIVVHIVIDQDGNVISARTHSGHPFLRAPFLHSARAAKFPRTLYGPIKVKALLTYTLNPDGTIEF